MASKPTYATLAAAGGVFGPRAQAMALEVASDPDFAREVQQDSGIAAISAWLPEGHQGEFRRRQADQSQGRQSGDQGQAGQGQQDQQDQQQVDQSGAQGESA